jgi:hypothetical protein
MGFLCYQSATVLESVDNLIPVLHWLHTSWSFQYYRSNNESVLGTIVSLAGEKNLIAVLSGTKHISSIRELLFSMISVAVRNDIVITFQNAFFF